MPEDRRHLGRDYGIRDTFRLARPELPSDKVVHSSAAVGRILHDDPVQVGPNVVQGLDHPGQFGSLNE